jgi:uncharacterized FlaG/YvyC family protein
MIGPVSVPQYPGQAWPPITNPVPNAAESVDNPRAPVGNRQPLELPTERLDLAAGSRDPSEQEKKPSGKELIEKEVKLPEAPNSAVTFRILASLDNRIQSRVVDRQTQEVIRSTPSEGLVDFYERFRELNPRVDLEA